MGRSGEPARRSVLDAVGKIVTEQGLEGIRVRQIAAAADLSPGAVLYHFPKNSDLLYAVHKDTIDRYMTARLLARDSAAGPMERLLAVMRAGVPPWADEKVIRLFYEMHGLARRSEAHAELLSDLWIFEHALYTDILESGAADGVFALSDPASDVATGLLALEDGLVLHLISNNTAFDGEHVVRQFAHCAAALLGCPDLIALGDQASPPAVITDDTGTA